MKHPGVLSEEERFLSAHIADMQRLAQKSGVPRFSAFLNEREQLVADFAVKGELCFFGGYEGAQRKICGVLSGTYAQDLSFEECFPLTAASFTFRKIDKLTHRDFLGALLSLGIKRELLGDILVTEGFAVVFVHENAESAVCSVERIGKIGVHAEKGITKPLPQQELVQLAATVSSLRLDCIVGAAAGISREKSASLIKSGLVNADFSPCLNVSREIDEGTVISVRGYGRFRLSQISGETKKGRLRIILEKYV